ncbi:MULTISPECIES: hypothetical protein [unclassified Synechocystis]|uniref:hypothetical protein n=1 Tax=unclassified Synechocystis TaxID=2640012 RepID=UPI001BAEB7D1|nr:MULTISPECIES: hypothetical protein [unclassified Synechocystis]
MSKLSQLDRVVMFLREYPNKQFSAKQIAQEIIKRYSDDYEEKRQNTRYTDDIDDTELIKQVAAEIGAYVAKGELLKREIRICWRNKPKPRIFWFDPEKRLKTEKDEFNKTTAIEEKDSSDIFISQVSL